MTVDAEEHSPDATMPAAAEDSPPVGALSYAPDRIDMLRILSANAALNLFTLGIYRFWAKTRIRQYIWSRLRFLDEPFEYSGTAKELLLGFLIVIAVLAPFLVAKAVLEIYWVGTLGEEDQAFYTALINLPGLVLFLFLLQIAIFRARRYRLTRTRWCGIVGGQSGTAVRYAFLYFRYVLLTAATLGICYPHMSTALQRYRIANTWVGNTPFEFSGRGGALMRPWLLNWILFVPTFGFSHIWYRAAELRYFVGQTNLDSYRFESRLTGGRILSVYIVYWIFLLGSLVFAFLIIGALTAIVALLTGIGQEYFQFDSYVFKAGIESLPFASVGLSFVVTLLLILLANVLYTLIVVNSLLKYFCETLEVTGVMDTDTLAQGDHPAPSRGEGLADALDIGGL